MPDQLTNVVSLLAEAAQRSPERLAIVVEQPSSSCSRINYSNLWNQVDRVGRGLANLGVGRDDRVVVMVPMSIELYVVLLAVLKVGAATVFVDPWIGRRQIANFTAFAQPKGFVGIAKSHLLRLIDARLRQIPVAVTTGRSVLGLPSKYQLSQFLSQPGDGAVALVAPDDTALVTFTTGSSGTPKGANRTHGYLLAQHQALQQEFPYAENDVDLTMFPVFALNNLARGITTVVPRIDFRKVAQADGNAILQQIRREQVSTLTASPPLVDRLAEAVKCTGGTPAIRRILVGGAPVGDHQLQDWLEIFPNTEILVVYGSTEVEPVAHIEASERLSKTSVLRPLTPGFCTGIPTGLLDTKLIRITKEPIELGSDGWSEWEVASGKIGELVVNGKHVGKEYYGNTEAAIANKILDAKGSVWHRMGDTGYFDQEGYFWLTGRVHSTIYRNGKIIQPQLVEQAAMGPDQTRVAALGLKNSEQVEHLLVVVETSNCQIDLARDVFRRLSDRGVEIDEVLLTSEPLPVDPRHNSKIDYQKLRDQVDLDRDGSQFHRWPAAKLAASEDGTRNG